MQDQGANAFLAIKSFYGKIPIYLKLLWLNFASLNFTNFEWASQLYQWA